MEYISFIFNSVVVTIFLIMIFWNSKIELKRVKHDLEYERRENDRLREEIRKIHLNHHAERDRERKLFKAIGKAYNNPEVQKAFENLHPGINLTDELSEYKQITISEKPVVANPPKSLMYQRIAEKGIISMDKAKYKELRRFCIGFIWFVSPENRLEMMNEHFPINMSWFARIAERAERMLGR